MSEERLDVRDGEYVARLMPVLRMVCKLWYRSEVHGIERVPDGGALLVSNHSGGMIAMDVPVIAVAFAEHFGDRPLYCLAHDLLFTGYAREPMRRAGFIPATREAAAGALRAGAATIVFPGGDYDAFRPTSARNTIDFAGRTGYVRTAVEAGGPIVPIVSIGGQESQLHLSRGEWIASLFGLQEKLRSKYAPVTFGFPFGLNIGVPFNLPLPTKIVTEVLEPIDVEAEFGPDPDVDEVDRAVRDRMQEALDELARRRRFPVLG
ncbi:MAG: 1-acyl-sn-glycerol-3-phosphate acyltransferase [Marmoricola sp.]|nr:1-acyl-sn-glycerol-3-phosphate acyltransferase [Marmoricola sp.]